MKSYLTVEDLLSRKHFVDAEVITGVSGLHRVIKWVHVTETVQIRNLLKGQELILTTGLGWKDNPKSFIHFVRQLIDSNAAGICIELNTYINEIPQSVIDLAKKHEFPIIVFNQKVLFVEITHDIHSLIINNQYQLLSELEQYTHQLNNMLLEINGYEQILQYLQKSLDVQVITLFINGRSECYPFTNSQKTEVLLEQIKSEVSENKILKRPVHFLGDTYAELIIISKKRPFSHFDALVLDRTATAFGQLLLRELYVSEKQMVTKNHWLTLWLKGEYKEDLLAEQFKTIDSRFKFSSGIVWLCELIDLQSNTSNKDIIYFQLLSKTIFEQFGFYLISVEFEKHLVFICLNKRDLHSWKSRMEAAFGKIKNYDHLGKKGFFGISIGAGEYVHDLQEINKSYQTALQTLKLNKQVQSEQQSYFFQDLHMIRMLSLLKQYGNLEETVNQYLQPVIDYDRKHNSDLLSTLKMYLACNGSKQETSKKLFIVRQTLYHRIEKLEDLLGNDFMTSRKRFIIEFMLEAYEFLSNSKADTSYKEIGITKKFQNFV